MSVLGEDACAHHNARMLCAFLPCEILARIPLEMSVSYVVSAVVHDKVSESDKSPLMHPATCRAVVGF